MTQQDIINDNIIKQYEIRVQQDIEKIKELQQNLVDALLERDELDEQYKKAVARFKDAEYELKELTSEHKEACYVIGKMSIENTNLQEENNRLAVIVSAQEKQITELEEDQRVDTEYQDLVRIATCLYKADKDSIKEMINEGLGGDAFEKFKDHLGV